jgi:hypothetical protein
VPVQQQIDCPGCGAPLVRKPGGRCPKCGADVRAHVQAERERETRIEKVVAVIGTLLVVSLSVFVGGCTIVEGALAYAAAGALIWYWGRHTFTT